ncbi:MAG TPA: cyclic nucleotide-binding domain-containing protein [Edaphobacter sp.]|nr:cyclic nucleotide-binding domain-containing protein [Edaphobacter sp.]
MQNSFIADRTLIQALEQRSVSVPCSEGRILFKQGEPPIGLYLLKTGKASLIMKTDKGQEVVHLTVGSGSILGLPAIVGNVPYTLSAMAHHGSEVNFLARKEFEELIHAQPSLYPKVLEVLAAEVRSARLALTGIMGKLGSRASRISPKNQI